MKINNTYKGPINEKILIELFIHNEYDKILSILFEEISDDSPFRDEIIIIYAKYNRNKKLSRLGLIFTENQFFKIQNSLLQLIHLIYEK